MMAELTAVEAVRQAVASWEAGDDPRPSLRRH